MPPITTKNLGQVQAIFIGTTAPSNIAMLWYNTNVGENRHYYYNTITLVWTLLTSASGNKVFTNATTRALTVPDFNGQIGVQLDTDTVYQSTGTSAGDWILIANTQIQSDTYAVATGTNTYVVTLAPPLVVYAAGNSFNILFTNANTGACTINVNSLGAKSIKKNDNITLVTNDIIAGKIYKLTYDGTDFQIESNDSVIANVQVSADKYAVASGTNTYTLTLSPIPTAYVAGNMYNVKFTNTNTGASTINVNGLGAKSIFYNGVALIAGEIVASTAYSLLYDGTQFHLIGSVGSIGGEWTNVPFNAANFYADGPAVWTVQSGDVRTNRYKIIGKTMFWRVDIDGSTISGSPIVLYMNLPNGNAFPNYEGFSNTGIYESAFVTDQTLQTYMLGTVGEMRLLLNNGAAFTNGTNNQLIAATMMFEIQ